MPGGCGGGSASSKIQSRLLLWLLQHWFRLDQLLRSWLPPPPQQAGLRNLCSAGKSSKQRLELSELRLG